MDGKPGDTGCGKQFTDRFRLFFPDFHRHYAAGFDPGNPVVRDGPVKVQTVSPAVQRRHRFLLDFFLQTGDFRRPDIRGIGDQHINFLRHKAQSL